MIVVFALSIFTGSLFFFSKFCRLRQSIIASAITHFAFILFSSEILGLINSFSSHYIRLLWILPILAWTVLLGRKIPALTTDMFFFFTRKTRELQGFNAWIVFMLATVAFLTLLIAATALPNNWDSLTYHLPRMSFWLQNHNLSHFPTEDYRMLFNPPLSELAMAHFWVLGGEIDQFMNLVQWFAYILLILAASSTTEVLGAGLRGQLISSLFTATIPGLVMQAETTQNDLLMGTLMLSALPFLMTALHQWSVTHWTMGILAAGLALTTKATAFMFLPFALVVPAFLAMKQKRFLAVAAFALAILPSSGWMGRNYNFFGNPLGYETDEYMKQKINCYSSEYFSPRQAVSSLSKNLSLFTATPSVKINKKMTALVKKIHSAISIDPDDSRLTWLYSKYAVPLSGPHEDSAPSFWHCFLVFVVLIWTFSKGYKDISFPGLWLTISGMAGLLASCIYIKWMPWNGRFLVIWLTILLTASGQAWERWPTKIVNFLCLLFFVAAIPFTILSIQRSLFWGIIRTNELNACFTSIFTHDAASRYMAEKPVLAEPLKEIIKVIAAKKPSCIGIIKRGGDHAVYPLMSMTRKEMPGTKFSFPDPCNFSVKLTQSQKPLIIVALGTALPSPNTTNYESIFRNDFGSVWRSIDRLRDL